MVERTGSKHESMFRASVVTRLMSSFSVCKSLRCEHQSFVLDQPVREGQRTYGVGRGGDDTYTVRISYA